MTMYVVIGLILLHSVTGTGGVLDITCTLSPARINAAVVSNIHGYKGDDVRYATVTYGRAINTGTGDGLPSYSSQYNHNNVPARVILLPQSGGKERIGAFNCQAEAGGVTERVTVTAMANNADIIPQHISPTVNIGENARFVMDTTSTIPISDLRWRLNGGDIIAAWNGRSDVTIDSVTLGDAGVYECYRDGYRADGTHAIFQLMVRACEYRKWGPPNCEGDCPQCYNGGICDDRSGVCVCAPGFRGDNCEIVVGRNRLGQNGERQCSGSSLRGDGCRGKLHCLPHPYGCSCAPSYKGNACYEECTPGYYGASCRLECHCAPGATCLKDTGECVGGNCLEGWSGVNCQQQCYYSGQVTNIAVHYEGNTIVIDWEPEQSICIDKQYVVEYELINLDQCQQQTASTVRKAGQVMTASFNITGLEYHSTYNVYITTILNDTYRGPRSLGVTATTGEAELESPPFNVSTSDLTSTTITFKWLEPPCGTRNGNIRSYSYILHNTESGEETASSSTELKYVTFGTLDPFTNYTFSVAAVTAAGEGPYYTLFAVTNQKVLSAPVLQVVETTRTSISVMWQKHKYADVVIDKYLIQSKTVAKPYDLKFAPASGPEQELFLNDADQNRYTISGLKPSTKYEIKVFAHSTELEGGIGEAGVVEQFTDVAAVEDLMRPIPLPILNSQITTTILNSQITTTTIAMKVRRSTSEFLTGYQVGVEMKSDSRKRQAPQFGHYTDSLNMYVAAELQKDVIIDDYEFLIGDNQTYGMFYNPPLEEGKTYTLYIAYVSRIDKTTYGVSWSGGMEVTTPSYHTERQCRSCNDNVTTITAVFVCITITLIVFLVVASLKIRSLYKHLQSQGNQELKSSPIAATQTKQLPANKQIHLSADGYAEYKPEVSKYEDLSNTGAGGQGTPKVFEENAVSYEEIPAPMSNSLDNKTSEEGAYYNDSVRVDASAAVKEDNHTLYEEL